MRPKVTAYKFHGFVNVEIDFIDCFPQLISNLVSLFQKKNLLFFADTPDYVWKNREKLSKRYPGILIAENNFSVFNPNEELITLGLDGGMGELFIWDLTAGSDAEMCLGLFERKGFQPLLRDNYASFAISASGPEHEICMTFNEKAYNAADIQAAISALVHKS